MTDSPAATLRLDPVRTAFGDRLTISARIVDAGALLDTLHVAQVIVHSSRYGPHYYTLLSRALRDSSHFDIRHLIQTDVAKYLVWLYEQRDAPPSSPTIPYFHEDGWMLV